MIKNNDTTRTATLAKISCLETKLARIAFSTGRKNWSEVRAIKAEILALYRSL